MAAKRTRLFATVLLAGNLIFSLVPVTAFAVPSSEIQAELDAAEAELSGLYAQSEEVAENLNATRVQLEQIQGQIEENGRRGLQGGKPHPDLSLPGCREHRGRHQPHLLRQQGE